MSFQNYLFEGNKEYVDDDDDDPFDIEKCSDSSYTGKSLDTFFKKK